MMPCEEAFPSLGGPKQEITGNPKEISFKSKTTFFGEKGTSTPLLPQVLSRVLRFCGSSSSLP
jgi:hypothetical protein